MRRCARCKIEYPQEIFYVTPQGNLSSYCPECAKEKRKEGRARNADREREQKRIWNKKNAERVRETTAKWRANNPEKMKQYAENKKARDKEFNRHAFYNHGITQDQTQQVFDFQEAKCPICLRDLVWEETTKRRIDHDYTTGLVRGLLCKRCNPVLGWYENHVERIEAYLANPPTAQLGLEITTKRRQKDVAEGRRAF